MAKKKEAMGRLSAQDFLSGKENRPSIVQVFINTSLIGQHNHLTEVALKFNRDPKKLHSGQMLIFINRARTLMKAFVGGHETLACVRKDFIDFAAIEHLPDAFGYTGKVDYDYALRLAYGAKLGDKNGN